MNSITYALRRIPLVVGVTLGLLSLYSGVLGILHPNSLATFHGIVLLISWLVFTGTGLVLTGALQRPPVLNPGEEVVEVYRPKVWVPVIYHTVGLIGAFLTAHLYYDTGMSVWTALAGIATVWIGGKGLYKYLQNRLTRYYITTQRVICDRRLVTRQLSDIYWPEDTKLECEDGLLDRIFGIGTLCIKSVETNIRFESVKRPKAVGNDIVGVCNHAYQKHQEQQAKQAQRAQQAEQIRQREQVGMATTPRRGRR